MGRVSIFTMGAPWLLVFALFMGCASTPPEKSTMKKMPGHGAGFGLSYARSPEDDTVDISITEENSWGRDAGPLDRLVQPYGFQNNDVLRSRNSLNAVQYGSIIRNLSNRNIDEDKFTLTYNGMLKKIFLTRTGANEESRIRSLPHWGLTRISQLVRPQGFQSRNFLTSEYTFEGYQYASILHNIYNYSKDSKGSGGGLLDTDFPMVHNSSVTESIEYLKGKENFMNSSLARAEEYLPLMTSIFRENELPEDLAYLSLIESGFNPCAYSRAGACGPWQFMKGTAKRYGLTMDKWVDERRDPEKSTRAAVAYLKDLYGMFGDWYLAVTAYNAGEGKVAEAIRRYNSTDLWYLREKDYLKLESRDFVPKLLAAITIGKQPEDHGFSELEPEGQVRLAKVHIAHSTDLKVIAEMAGISLAELKRYNPELSGRCTPPRKEGYWINVPKSKKEVFAKKLSQNKKAAIPPSTLQEHRIKRGETLHKIARQYNTNVDHILKLNGIKNPQLIWPGQVILVPGSSCTPS